jgi:ADP-ribose pyrophosphatase
MSKNLTEVKIQEDLVWKGNFLEIKRDLVSLPNGKQTSREYINHQGAALVIPMLSSDRVLMVRQFRYPLNKVFLEFPSGKIDQGESSEQTAHRELKEETGYEAKNLKFLTTIHPVIGYADEKIDLYLAQNITQIAELQLDDEEFLELIEIEVKELPMFIKNGLLSDVKTQIAAFWLEKELNLSWSKSW